MLLRIVILSVLLSLLAGIKHASANLSIQGLPPATGLSFSFVETANTNQIRGRMISPGAFFLNTQYSYINDPLTWSDTKNSKVLVDGLHTMDLRTGVLLRDDLNISLNLSLNTSEIPAHKNVSALGDSVAQMKYRMTDIDEDIQVALIPELYIPVGNEKDYISTGEFGGALRLALMRTWERFKLSTNFGYRYLPGAVLKTLDYRKQVILGIGSEFILTDRLSINLEGMGFLSTPYIERNSTGEVYFGALWSFSPLTVLSAGFSRTGFDKGINQTFRGIVGLKSYFGENKEVSAASTATPLRQIASVKRCHTEPYTNTYHSRPLTDFEYARLKGLFPYAPNVNAHYMGDTVKISNLKYGEMTGMARDDFPIVKDSQIPFAIDMNDVPVSSTIKKINHAWLKLRVNKLSQDHYLGTEILCSLNFKLCSGSTLQQEKWGDLFNPRFFDGKERIVNNKFSRLYLDKPVGHVNGENLYSKMLTFPLDDLIEGSTVEMKHFFQRAKNGKKTLYFVVADDTFLSNEVSLEVSMGVERCAQSR